MLRLDWFACNKLTKLTTLFMILKGNASAPLKQLESVITLDELIELRKATNEIFVKDDIYEYIVNIVEETRRNEIFSMGASPRGTIAMLKMAKAMAVIDGRDYVTAEDVQNVTRDTLGHRVKLGQRARATGLNMDLAIRKLLEIVQPPRN